MDELPAEGWPVRLLMFQAERFRFRAESAPEDTAVGVEEAVVAFVHAEAEDESQERLGGLVSKAAKNLKWLANKRGLRTVVLHSFNHLGESKAQPEFARRLLATLTERLEGVGYRVVSTPFGRSCAWDLSVYEEPLAKVFKRL